MQEVVHQSVDVEGAGQEVDLKRRRLDAELVRRGLVRSRERAREAIESGSVLVSGSVADKASRLVDPAEPIEVTGSGPRFVSRGGEKLSSALDAFDLSPRGWRCLDLGASTGGFTDCLLQHGAAHVVAVDVGRGQLDWSLRTDERVTSTEQTDVRELDADSMGPFDLVVADLSFISLRTVMGSVATVARDAPVVALVKPQFEVGRSRVGKGGVVRDPDVQAEAVEAVAQAARAAGFSVDGEHPSPILGAEGNREFFLLMRRGSGTSRTAR